MPTMWQPLFPKALAMSSFLWEGCGSRGQKVRTLAVAKPTVEEGGLGQALLCATGSGNSKAACQKSLATWWVAGGRSQGTGGRRSEILSRRPGEAEPRRAELARASASSLPGSPLCPRTQWKLQVAPALC